MFGFDDYCIGVVDRRGKMVFVRVTRPDGMDLDYWRFLASGFCEIMNA